MASVKRYTSEDYDLVCEFVKRASGIETVNEEIIAHSVLIKNDEEVTGMVSYEKFDGLEKGKFIKRREYLRIEHLDHVHLSPDAIYQILANEPLQQVQNILFEP